MKKQYLPQIRNKTFGEKWINANRAYNSLNTKGLYNDTYNDALKAIQNTIENTTGGARLENNSIVSIVIDEQSANDMKITEWRILEREVTEWKEINN